MDDEQILERGGTERDIEEYAKLNGADMSKQEISDKFIAEFGKWKIYDKEGNPTDGNDMVDFFYSLHLDHIKAIREKIEGMRKYHKEFECNGAHNGKGCYETFCEDQNCRNAPKEYNQALDDVLLTIAE